MSGEASRSLSVVVVSWNTRDVLRGCLERVRRHLPHAELVLVDNGSSDGSAEMVGEEFKEARLLRNPGNRGFGAAANQGMREASAENLLLLNSDAYLVDDSVRHLLPVLRREPDVGVVGPRIVLETGNLQRSARRFPSVGRLMLSELWLHRLLSRPAAAERLLGSYWAHDIEHEADWLVGACLLVRREVFLATGGFDPSIFLYGEEVEWCRRVRAAGWRILFSPAAQVQHLNHKSADRLFGDDGRVDRCLLSENDLLRRWQGRWAPPVADGLRLAGALLRGVAFGARHLLHPGDVYARDVLEEARTTIAHYLRRLRGRTWEAAP